MRHGDRLLSRLTKENNRFLDLRDRIIPSLTKEIEGHKDFIKVFISLYFPSEPCDSMAVHCLSSVHFWCVIAGMLDLHICLS